jgi:hypothetical protein
MYQMLLRKGSVSSISTNTLENFVGIRFDKSKAELSFFHSPFLSTLKNFYELLANPGLFYYDLFIILNLHLSIGVYKYILYPNDSGKFINSFIVIYNTTLRSPC